MKFPVKPEVLSSVRKRYGIPIHIFAHKIKEPVSTVKKWEQEGAELSPTKMQLVADTVSCHWSVLLRDDPLPAVQKPANKRTSAHRDGYTPDVRTLVSYRESSRLLDHISFSKAPSLKKELQTILSMCMGESKAEDCAMLFSKTIAYDRRTAVRLADSRRVYAFVVAQIERLGVYVSEQSFDSDDLKGFMLSKDDYYLVVINSDDKFPASKLFTLLHEIGHILSGQKSSACDLHEVKKLDDSVEREESFCNIFAAAFLMPRKDFLEDQRVVKIGQQNDYLNSENVSKIASSYRTSFPATVRRLYQLGVIKYPDYEKLNREFYNEILPKIIEQKNKKTEIKLPRSYYVNKEIKKASRTFTSLIIGRYSAGQISSGEVKRSLGISTRYLADMQQMVENGR